MTTSTSKIRVLAAVVLVALMVIIGACNCTATEEEVQGKHAQETAIANESSESWAGWAKDKISEGLGFKGSDHDQFEEACTGKDAADAAAKKIKDKITDAATGGGEYVKDAAGEKAREAKGKASEAGVEEAYEAKEKAKEGYETAKEKAEEHVGWAKEKAKKGYATAKDKAGEIYESARDTKEKYDDSAAHDGRDEEL